MLNNKRIDWRDYMNYRKPPHSFRYGLEIFTTQPKFRTLWEEVLGVIEGITDEDIIEYFNKYGKYSKSISDTINRLIDQRLITKGWSRQSYIFNDPTYKIKKESRWTLDFAKDDISIEVAFNHGEAVAWNLIKPVLASELNHVEKAIQTKAGIIITATDALREAGGFDGAVGTYEKYLQYLKPLNNLLTVPMVIIGLEPPETFRIDHYKEGGTMVNGKVVGAKTIGGIVRNTDVCQLLS